MHQNLDRAYSRGEKIYRFSQVGVAVATSAADSELRCGRGCPQGASGGGQAAPSIDVANVLLDERRELTGDLNYRQ